MGNITHRVVVSEDKGGLDPRRAALDVLERIYRRHSLMDQAFEQSEYFQDLMPADKAFSRRLICVVLQRQGQLDALAQKALDRDLSELKPQTILNVLRLGIAQMCFMETPDHASVNTTVELADKCGLGRQKGLINAVMRRLGREGEKYVAEQDERRMNIPDWMWDSWVDAYGEEVSLKIGGSILNEMPLDITVKSDVDEWAKKFGADVLPTGTVRVMSSGSLYEMPGFNDGEWWVQGASAALPAMVLGNVQGKTVVDLCAAPGGKTAQVANAGAKVIALDKSPRRLKRLDENMERLGLSQNVETVAADGAVWQPSEKVDVVLLDAPCTATGTTRHQPDVLRLKKPEDVTRLCDTQERLLNNAVQMLKPGGILVYCTCSLQKEECDDQVTNVLNHYPNVLKRSAIDPKEIGGWDMMIDDLGQIRSHSFHLEDQGGIDGFFVARLIRN